MSQPPDFRLIAAQLRRPEGDFGIEIGRRMNESNRVLNEEALLFLGIKAGPATLVEIGMGNGAFVTPWLLRYPDLSYIGIDYAPTMVEEAKALNASLVATGRAQFLAGEAHHLPLPDGGADFLLTANTIYFWEEPLAVLKEFYRILRPGGHAMIALRSEATMQHLPFTEYGFTRYSREKLEELLIASPFTSAEIHVLHEDMRTDASGRTAPADSFLARLTK